MVNHFASYSIKRLRSGGEVVIGLKSAVAHRFAMAGRRALVTGASMSIGRAIALALAEAGADIAVHHAAAADRAMGLPNAAADTVRAIAGLGRRAEPLDANLTEQSAGRRLVSAAETALGPLDVLVICASVQARMAFQDITVEEVERETRVNLLATIDLLQAVLPGMRTRGWGRVLAIGSVNQVRPEPELALYAALKSAQHNLIINLARQYAPYGVTLNTLSPGLVATERNRWRRADEAQWAAIQRTANPMGRAGTPEEMAGAALLLCSDAGAFITGAELHATGGGHL
jgi:NAD(P)-dependent dehydrogenase (short-subunit alcohol dehydrogenase family)